MFVRGHLVVFYTIKNEEYSLQQNWLFIIKWLFIHTIAWS